MNPLVLRYLNRLSDLLFILARAANARPARRAAVEAWELALALAGSFAAGYVGLDAGARARDAAAAADRRPDRQPARGRGNEHRDLRRIGRRRRRSVTPASAGSTGASSRGWRRRRSSAPSSARSLADDVSERAALRGDRGRAGLERDRPRVRPVRARARERLRLWPAVAGRRRHRRARRRGRRHPRDAADAGARPRRRDGRQARGRDEPRRRLPPRRRGLRHARGRRSGSTGRSSSPGSPARSPAAGSARRRPDGSTRARFVLALGVVLVVVGVAFAVQAVLG